MSTPDASPETAAGDGEASVELFDLRIVVDRFEGRPVCGMRVGDSFEVRHSSRVTIPAGQHFCMYAMGAVLPLLAAKQRPLAAGDWMAHDAEVACPDPEERCIMRIERIGSGIVRLDDAT